VDDDLGSKSEIISAPLGQGYIVAFDSIETDPNPNNALTVFECNGEFFGFQATHDGCKLKL
jgi:hypothetical protein